MEAPAWKLIGIEIISLGRGRTEMAMEVKEKHLNIYGACHGGITAAFADTLMGIALYTMDAVCTTIEMNINFMEPVKAGQRLIGRGEVLRKGRTTAVIRADMFVGETMVATARGTYKIVKEISQE